MSKTSSISICVIFLYANSIIFPFSSFLEALISCLIAAILTLFMWMIFNLNLPLLPLSIIFIIISAKELIIYSYITNGFLSDTKETVLITTIAICVFILFAGIKSISYLSQILFWSIPVIFILFLFSLIGHQITFINYNNYLISGLKYSLNLIIPIILLMTIIKNSQGNRNNFVLGVFCGLIALLIQGLITSLFGSLDITNQHPLLVCAKQSSLPIEAFMLGVMTFAGILRIGLYLIGSQLLLKKYKYKNIFIIGLFIISLSLIYFTSLS